MLIVNGFDIGGGIDVSSAAQRARKWLSRRLGTLSPGFGTSS